MKLEIEINGGMSVSELLQSEFARGKRWVDFTREKEFVQHGHRLENLSWRIWFIQRKKNSQNLHKSIGTIPSITELHHELSFHSKTCDISVALEWRARMTSKLASIKTLPTSAPFVVHSEEKPNLVTLSTKEPVTTTTQLSDVVASIDPPSPTKKTWSKFVQTLGFNQNEKIPPKPKRPSIFHFSKKSRPPPKGNYARKRSISVGERDISSCVGEESGLFNKEVVFDSGYLRKLISDSPSIRAQIWLLLIKQAEIFYKKELITIEQCQDALLKYSTEEKMKESSFSTQIEKDIPRTIVCSTVEELEQQEKLRRVLITHSDWNFSVGYCQSHSYVAAILVSIFSPPGTSPSNPENSDTVGNLSEENLVNEANALFAFRGIIDFYLPKDFYASKLEGLIAEMETFNYLLGKTLPDFMGLMKHILLEGDPEYSDDDLSQIPTNTYVVTWFSILFINAFPLQTTLRIWDAFLCDGIEILHRVALSIFKLAEERLLLIDTHHGLLWELKTISTEMVAGTFVDADKLLDMVYTILPFPDPTIHKIRKKNQKQRMILWDMNHRNKMEAEKRRREKDAKFWREMETIF